jgi:hypothetical protein
VSEKRFYVYEHWRPDRGECFYVGKGHGRRAYDMRRGRNRWHKFLTAKLSALGTAAEVKIIFDGLTEGEAFAKEIERIAFWKNDGADLVNSTLGGEGPTGRKHTEEWKRAISEKQKGKKMSAEARANMSLAAMGNTRAKGCKRARHLVEALIVRNTGRIVTEETRRKMSASRKGQFLGRKLTDEWRSNISAAQLGIPKSEETKQKMRGIQKSDAHKQKLRECNLGKTHSEETRRKISEISKADWARRKALKADVVEKIQQSLIYSSDEKT